MLVRYSSLNRLEKPKFTLCNPGSVCTNGMLSKVVGMLVDTEAEEIVFNFNATSELNLRVNRIIRDDPEENAHTFAIYKAVQNRRLIFVDDIGYFMITNIEDGFDGHNHYKDVTAKSVDTEISQKMVPFIDNNTYRFSTDETGTNKGMLETIVETLPLWTIEHVDDVVAERWRTFEDIDTSLNCLAFMLQNMQDAYECLFIYDIVSRTISVYDQANYVRQTNIHITKEDLINSLDITENADDLFTAVSVIGDDNVTIAAINPLGTNVIYDFTYYLSWMSDSLSAKVIAWQNAIEAERESYYNLNLGYFNKMTEASNLEMEIEKLDTQITMYNRCRNNIVAENSTDLVGSYNEAIAEAGGEQITIQDSIEETLAVIDNLIAECESNKENNQAILETRQAELEAVKAQVDAVRERLKITSYFTEEEYTELCHYIFEGSYSDDYVVITDIMSYDDKFAQMKILYDRAMSQLQRASQPTQEFSVDVENFIFIKEFEEWSEQLETGCLINVELDVNDIAALFLSNMTINYDDHTLKMTFGNRFNRFDPKSLFNDVLGKISRSANTLDYIKDIIYPIKNGEFSHMQEALQTSRDLTMRAALASTTEEVIIDGSGYTGRRLLNNGEYDQRQVKIVCNSMVFTDDGWESCKVAIGEILLGDGDSIYGINAEAIMGQFIIGEHLNIINESGNLSFNNDGLNITNGINSFRVNPNQDKLLAISNSTGDVFYVDRNGVLHIHGDGAGLDISTNDSVTGLDSKITQTAEEIRSEVSATKNELSSSITQTAEEIRSEVSDTKNELSSSITQNADAIALKVSKDKVVSAINISPESITISASKIDVDGVLNVEKLNALAIKAGSVDAENISGTTITGKTISGGSIEIGSNFSVSNTGVMTCSGATVNGVLTAGTGSSIGGFETDENSLFKGDWSSASDITPEVFICTGTSGSYTLGGKKTNGWAFGAGDNFGVTKDGDLYASNATLTGGKIGGWDIKEYGLLSGSKTYIYSSGVFLFSPATNYWCGFLETDTDTGIYNFVISKSAKLEIGDTTLSEDQLKKLLALI